MGTPEKIVGAVTVGLIASAGIYALAEKFHSTPTVKEPIPVSTPAVLGPYELISIPFLLPSDPKTDCLPGTSTGEPVFSPTEEPKALARVDDFRKVFKRVINTEGILKGLTQVDDAKVLDPDFDSRKLHDQVLYQTVLRGNPHSTLNRWQPSFSDTKDGQGFSFITSYPGCDNLDGTSIGTRLNLDLLQKKLGAAVDATDPRDKSIKVNSLEMVLREVINVPANASWELGFDDEHSPLKTPALRFTGKYPDGSTVDGMLDTLGTIRVLVKEPGSSTVQKEDIKKVARGIISDKYQDWELQYSEVHGNYYEEDLGDFMGSGLFIRDQDTRNPLVVSFIDTYKTGVLINSSLRIGNGLSQPEAKAVAYETEAGNGDWRIPAERLQEVSQALFSIQQPQFKLGKQSYPWGEVDSINFSGLSTKGKKVTGYLDAKGQGTITINEGKTAALIPGRTDTFQARLAQGSAARAANVERARLAALTRKHITVS